MISFLVPFRDDGEHRTRVWAWLKQYWEASLPGVEIIEGRYDGVPFSKAIAVNEAASRATGDVFVILDADAYLPAEAVKYCAERIARRGRTWYVPYDHLYRLGEEYTLSILDTDPTTPIPVPPTEDLLDTGPRNQSRGAHKHGAMCQIMPRAAFETVKGFDPRFCQGWGSEDSSLKRSVDTLFAPARIHRGPIAHLWHARIGENDGGKTRMWQGQARLGLHKALGKRYRYAYGKPHVMRKLIAERESWAATTAPAPTKPATPTPES